MDGPGGLGLDRRLQPRPGAGPRPRRRPAAADSSNNYALPYALVIMVVALGMLVVLRGSIRRERERPEEYQSKDMLARD